MERQAWPMFFSWDFSFSFLKPSGVGVGVGRNSLLFLSRLISFFFALLIVCLPKHLFDVFVQVWLRVSTWEVSYVNLNRNISRGG